MYREFYRDSALLWYPLAALLFFVALFVVAVLVAFRRRNGDRIALLGTLPLDDDDAPSHLARPDRDGARP
jgi:hypothetical protein